VQIYSSALTPGQISLLDATFSAGLLTDQRGDSRRVGSKVDIGATEYQYNLAISGSAPAQVGANNLITYRASASTWKSPMRKHSEVTASRFSMVKNLLLRSLP